jgi:hypothetical protein
MCYCDIFCIDIVFQEPSKLMPHFVGIKQSLFNEKKKTVEVHNMRQITEHTVIKVALLQLSVFLYSSKSSLSDSRVFGATAALLLWCF